MKGHVRRTVTVVMAFFGHRVVRTFCFFEKLHIFISQINVCGTYVSPQLSVISCSRNIQLTLSPFFPRGPSEPSPPCQGKYSKYISIPGNLTDVLQIKVIRLPQIQ
jgi:hypothetical protein